MTESIDEYFTRVVPDSVVGSASVPDPEQLLRYLDAQIQSRHLDFAGRWLQTRGAGFYTIGSAGHESNAAIGAATRITDPALLHYRSGGFYAARAQQLPGSRPIHDVLAGVATSTSDPMSGGRHKVFGHPDLSIIPQTSTIGSQTPRAVGLAFALGRAAALGRDTPWPDDALVVCSFGDASANHSTTVGALNAAAYCAHQRVPMPILFVCEDNGIGISTRTPKNWLQSVLSRFPSIEYLHADGTRPLELFDATARATEHVRLRRAPAILHLSTVRLMGHAGSDAELAYRSRAEIFADYEYDPLLATARFVIGSGLLTPAQVLYRYEDARTRVMLEAEEMLHTKHFETAEQVMEPLTARRSAAVREAARGGAAGEASGTVAGAINGTLAEIMAERPGVLVFGEDVAVKGGVYGVTKGLRRRFGAGRVFDTLLDEQTIIGTALGAALAGFLPIPEIQYLAYVHNAEDQIRGEAATLKFFSNSQYANGMVVRIAGLAYQKGFGGHFHNDDSLTVFRDIPGLVVAVPSSAAEAGPLLRTCVALAAEEGRVCVFLEPIALYHSRSALDVVSAGSEFGSVSTHLDGPDVVIVTFGNGVPMSLRAAERLLDSGIDATVVDLRWIVPLPEAELLDIARRFDRVLIVDETRRGGGVSEGVVALLIDGGYRGAVRRVTSKDSLVPLGAAADLVLLSEDEIVAAANALCE